MEIVDALLAILVYLSSLKIVCTVNAIEAPNVRGFHGNTRPSGPGKGSAGSAWVSPSLPAHLSHLYALYARDPVSAILEYLEMSQSQSTNCTPISLHYIFSNSTYLQFKAQSESALRTANILNNLFQRPGEGTRDTLYKSGAESFYYSLVTVNLESDPLIYGSSIGFNQNKYGISADQHRTYFCPYVYRDKAHGRTVAVNLGQNNGNYLDTEWFSLQKNKYSGKILGTCGNDANVHNTTESDGTWTSRMTQQCEGGRTWTISYSVPFFGCDQSSDSLIFKGVVAIHIDLQRVDINQCAKDGMFANTHKCGNTTQCIPVPRRGFRRGSYICQCLDGFYIGSGNETFFSGSILEAECVNNTLLHLNLTDDHFQCLPCDEGCNSCTSRKQDVEYDIMLRGIPLGIQSFCMTISLVLGFVIVRLRATRVMKASMWVMLEIILVGALLLYSTVIIQYFEPSTITCILIPWFREVGFAVVYGALLLKVYKLLTEFQSRKAHRVHVRDKDLLKYLLGLVMVVVVYMSAWTAINMDHVSEGLLDEGITRDQLRYKICKSHWWDYVIEIAEVLFLCLGIYLCYCVRCAPSDYSEVKYVFLAIGNECIMSSLLYVARHVLWRKIHPDYIFLMYFLRCQLTVTITLIFILGPKLWYAHRPPEDEHFRSRAYSSSDVHDTILPESMKLHVGISSNGDVDVGEINLAEMDPEDIRAELKRLYTQLQIYKTKTMRKDNPHISKRRGGRKQTHRRFSLQAFHYKHRHHHDHDHEHELSKTPEESTNSAEGVAIEMEGRSRAEDEAPVRTPTVTFKPGHKSIG